MKHILIVDDHAHILRVMRLGLERANFKISSAGNGSEALSLLKTITVDAVVSDIDMPIMNGIDFCYAVFDEKETVKPKFFIVSGCITDRIETLLNVHPEIRFIEKPVSIAQLTKELNLNLNN